jgi:SulP family sulfate permease
MILISWFFKLERFIKKIPEFTVEGFTVGVALTIVATQLGSALGISLPSDIKEQFEKIVYFFSNLEKTNLAAFIVFATFLTILFIFKKYTPKFPGAIILSPIGIFLGYLAATGKTNFALKTLGEVFPTMTPKLFDSFSFVFDSTFLVPAFGVALIAVIETGISANIADKVTGTKHNEHKEVFGLGMANLVSGLMGGMPGTAALARTSLNIKSGADHKASAMINAICIILISFVFLTYFKYIPMAVIASILTFTAYQLVQQEPLIKMWRHNKKELALTVLVAAICIYKDTIYGIGIGIFIGLILNLIKKNK